MPLNTSLAIVLVALIGLSYDDAMGRMVRRWTTFILASAAAISLIAYRHLFPDVSSPWHAVYVLCLAAVAAACWKQNRRFGDLIAVVACLVISTGHLAEYTVGAGLRLVFLQGSKWLVWGAVFFTAGLFVSFAKGGQLRRMYRLLLRAHIALQRSLGDR